MNKYRAQSHSLAKQRSRLRSCTMKRAYPSAETALATGNAIYQCRYCSQWHTSGAAVALAAKLHKSNNTQPATRNTQPA